MLKTKPAAAQRFGPNHQIPVLISAQRAGEEQNGRIKEREREREKASLSTRRKTKVEPSLLDTHEIVVLHVTHSNSQPGRAAMRQRASWLALRLLEKQQQHQKIK